MAYRFVTGVTRKVPTDYQPQVDSKAPSKRQVATSSTLAFLALWQQLAPHWPTPTLEHRFHPTRKWRFDLAWLAPYWLALEIDGSIWQKGGHNTGKGMQRDREKDLAALKLGWRVVRITTDDLKKRPVQLVDDLKQLLGVVQE
jgi:very-short-patch-repair endonuclease